MKINEIIRAKRKEQKLTQEQAAEYLGVSTPAVNKWEKGISYPDITILPALARLLKVDLNTLLCFDEDLSQAEIVNFMNEICGIVQKEGFDIGFETAMKKIQKYPSDESLIISAALNLQGLLLMFGTKNKKEYEEKIEKLFMRVSCSNNIDIRNQANSMLISNYMSREEYDKAQALVDALPDYSVDKKQIQSNLYIKQGKYKEASRLLEEKILNSAADIQAVLLHMMDIAHKENRDDDAKNYAEISEKTVKLYDLWSYNLYLAQFQLAIANKDGDKCVEILKVMLPSMKKPWDMNKSILYKHLSSDNSEKSVGNMMIQGVIRELENDEELSFLRENPGFLKIIDRYKNIV